MIVNVCNIYVGNSTIHRNYKIKELCKCASDIEDTLNEVAPWSNLVFNPGKARIMIISSHQMSHYHHISNTVKIKSEIKFELHSHVNLNIKKSEWKYYYNDAQDVF